jgi:hypothetical protein
LKAKIADILKEQDCNAEMCGSVSCCGPAAYERGRADKRAAKGATANAHTSQRTEAYIWAGEIRHELDSIVEHAEKLRDVLDHAQNEPPEGGSDGSMMAEEWARLREIEATVFKLDRLVKGSWKHFSKGGSDP